MGNTGVKRYTTRKEYLKDPSTGLIDLSSPTGAEEANTTGTNYIADVTDTTACPLGTAYLQSYIPINNSVSAACADQSSQTMYHDGSGTYPANGDTVSTSASMSPVFNGNGKYYRVAEATGYSIIISSGGVVSNKTAC